MVILLYNMDESPPCHMVRLLAKTLGIELELKHISFEKREHKSPEYLKVNPLHRVPVIDDNGFIVGESRAILGYFMDQYAKDDSLYPKDAKQRTIINQRLYFDMGTLYQPFYDYYCHVFIDGKLGDPSILRKLEEAFQVLDKYLNGQDWVAGSNISIADYAILASVSNVESIGFDISKYPNVVKWHKKAQKAIPGYDEIVVPGSALLNHYYNKVKKC